LAILLCHVKFTEEQRNDILQEIQFVKSTVVERPSKMYIQSFMLDYLSIFVNWKSGRVDLALPLALECAKQVSSDSLLFGSKFEGISLLAISILLYECKEFDLASKLHKAASILHSLFCSQPLMEGCAPMFSSFMKASFSTCPPLPDELPNDESRIRSVVNKFLSLVSSFVPENDHSKLVSPHGMYVWYKTFSALCPLQPSLYELSFSLSLSFDPSSTLNPSSPPLSLPEEITSIQFETPLEANLWNSFASTAILTQF